MEYNPRVADAYTAHLGAVSAEHSCVACEDICNEFGLVLIKKGQPISPALAEKLYGHTLENDIDKAVGLEGALGAEDLLAQFKQLTERYRQYRAIDAQRGAEDLLESLCLSYPMPPVLLQKLSVLQLQLPEVFEQSLLGAWLAAQLALAAQWPVARVYSNFCAALFRDLGLLHIPPEVLEVETPNAEQRRALHAHPLLSRQIVADCHSFDDACAQAIAEHHEHPAGIGYPAGKVAHNCREDGQLVALASLLTERYGLGGRLDKCAAYLRVSVSVYQLPIYNVALRLFSATDFDASKAESPAAEQLGESVIDKMIAIGGVFAYLASLEHQLREIELDDGGRRFKARVDQAIALLHSTGLDNLDLLSLTDELSREGEVRDLLDTHLLEDEFMAVAEHVYRLGGKWLLTHKTLAKSQRDNIGSTLKALRATLD